VTSFREAVLADARVAAAYRGERHEFRTSFDALIQVLRLMLQTDAFFALAAYRLEVRLRSLGVPLLPWIAHRLSIVTGQLSIAETVTVHPGVFIPHGQVIIYGTVEVQPFASILPWVTLAPAIGQTKGPRIGQRALIGTGARVIGDVDVGDGARVGTSAVVHDDVPPNTTVVGMPARAIDA